MWSFPYISWPFFYSASAQPHQQTTANVELGRACRTGAGKEVESALP